MHSRDTLHSLAVGRRLCTLTVTLRYDAGINPQLACLEGTSSQVAFPAVGIQSSTSTYAIIR